MNSAAAVYKSAEGSQCGSYALNPWYLLKTKPCQEDRAKQFVSMLGADVLLPLYSTSKSKQPRPLFPGYMFGRFPLEIFAKVNNAFGMRKIVHFGGAPACVPQYIVTELCEQMDESAVIELAPKFADSRFKRGDRVAVTDGPFCGWYGVFDSETSSKERVKILLETLHFTRGFQQQAHGLSLSVEVSKLDLMLA